MTAMAQPPRCREKLFARRLDARDRRRENQCSPIWRLVASPAAGDNRFNHVAAGGGITFRVVDLTGTFGFWLATIFMAR